MKRAPRSAEPKEPSPSAASTPTVLRTAETRLLSSFCPQAAAAAIVAALHDREIVAILAEPDGSVWFERTAWRERSGIELASSEIETLIRAIAAHCGIVLGNGTPLISAEMLRAGLRFEAGLPPAVRAPSFALYKRREPVLDLADLVAVGLMDPSQAAFLRRAVHARKNILITGAGGSGKSMLANALVVEMERERVVIVERTVELRPLWEDHVPLRAPPGGASLSTLLRAASELNPARIVLGELQGAEASELLRAWVVRPGGVTTLRAATALAALAQLEAWLAETAEGHPRRLIAEAIHIVVCLVFDVGHRCLREIAKLSPGLAGYRVEAASLDVD